MKRLLSVFVALLTLVSCQGDLIPSSDGVGYLLLDIAMIEETHTKSAVPNDYDPEQLHVEIKNASGTIVKQTDNFGLEWKGQSIALQPGSYTITASSNGFDGNYSGERIPYYVGSTNVTIANANTPVTASIECKLANVKVTFHFDQSVLNQFRSLAIEVSSSVAGIPSQFASSSVTDRVVYFPVGDLKVKTSVTNMAGMTFSSERDIKGVKAQDHYILNCKLGDFGHGDITVQADGTEKEYKYTFIVPTKPSTQLEVKTPTVLWSGFVMLEGAIKTKTESFVPDPAFMKFEWKESAGNTWQKLSSTFDVDLYKAKLTGLKPATQYSCRLVYMKGSEEYKSDEVRFTTDAITELPYGNMDTWVMSGKTWYLGAAGGFWDSSNPGTTTGAGAMVNVNPTQGNGSDVHTSGGKSAELKSQFASALGIGKFAAGSLYSGNFVALVSTNGARINFGRSFTSRPTQLKGWYKYTSGKMNYVGSNLPAGSNIVKGQTDDLWSAYVVLTNGTYELNNTDMTNTSKDFEAILKNGKDSKGFDVIAYGALTDAECVSSTTWKEFVVNLTYRNLVDKPTHIIIVFSSSKYGDYFTGSTSSLLRLDDLEFVYGDDPILLKK